MLDYYLPFGSAACCARLAIHASYSGVPLLGGNPWGSPPNHVGNVSAAVSPIVRLPAAHDISGKHAPKSTSPRISFTMGELYTLRFQTPHCRTTVVATLHCLTVMIPRRRIDGPDRFANASLFRLAMVRGSQGLFGYLTGRGSAAAGVRLRCQRDRQTELDQDTVKTGERKSRRRNGSCRLVYVREVQDRRKCAG